MIKKNEGGYTLVELLVVIGIIAILVAISVPLYLGQQRKAAMTEAISNLQQLRLLEEQYFAENGCYYREGNPPVCTDKTISGVTNIKAFLPGFKPGNEQDLNYTYRINLPSADVVLAHRPAGLPAGAAMSFDAIATPKAGTPAQQLSQQLSINDINVKSW